MKRNCVIFYLIIVLYGNQVWFELFNKTFYFSIRCRLYSSISLFVNRVPWTSRIQHFLNPWLRKLLDPWLKNLLDPWLRNFLDPWLRYLLDPWLTNLLDPWLKYLLNPWLREFFSFIDWENYTFYYNNYHDVFIVIVYQFVMVHM